MRRSRDRLRSSDNGPPASSGPKAAVPRIQASVVATLIVAGTVGSQITNSFTPRSKSKVDQVLCGTYLGDNRRLFLVDIGPPVEDFLGEAVGHQRYLQVRSLSSARQSPVDQTLQNGQRDTRLAADQARVDDQQ